MFCSAVTLSSRLEDILCLTESITISRFRRQRAGTRKGYTRWKETMPGVHEGPENIELKPDSKKISSYSYSRAGSTPLAKRFWCKSWVVTVKLIQSKALQSWVSFEYRWDSRGLKTVLFVNSHKLETSGWCNMKTPIGLCLAKTDSANDAPVQQPFSTTNNLSRPLYDRQISC